ncbi:hypothetical protein DL768_010319 [Monosporascus sp. mg162]|nr:hypothetical protein DL768_010319 [Monosporascus sp. mg162]
MVVSIDGNKFDSNWKHSEKSAEVEAIFMATDAALANSYRGQRFEKYRNNRDYRRLFHGTRRACRVGEFGDSLTLCKDEDCRLCRILDESFRVEYSRQNPGCVMVRLADSSTDFGARLGGGMFGTGIYTTPTSSKADNYVKNHHVKSTLHAMLICKAIEGLKISRGGILNYSEIVLYRNEAIVPVGVIMYTRKGWLPP